jgi:hypothetical protein
MRVLRKGLTFPSSHLWDAIILRLIPFISWTEFPESARIAKRCLETSHWYFHRFKFLYFNVPYQWICYYRKQAIHPWVIAPERFMNISRASDTCNTRTSEKTNPYEKRNGIFTRPENCLAGPKNQSKLRLDFRSLFASKVECFTVTAWDRFQFDGEWRRIKNTFRSESKTWESDFWVWSL